MKVFSALIIGCLLSFGGFCQNNTPTLPKSIISGTVSDSNSKAPIAGASVVLKNAAALVQTIVTKSDGKFSFSPTSNGSYTLEIAHIGYLPATNTLLLNGNTDLRFALTGKSVTLSGVAVTAQKNLVVQTPDKITYLISEGAITGAANLYSTILKVPGVSESNNNLLYEGKPITILLDNKMTNLTGNELKELLMSLQGTGTDKLDIQLHPSARYDAQGGVVFNIRSLKNKNYGLTETITASAGTGTFFRNTAGVSLNYRDSNLNIYGTYEYNRNKQYFLLHAYESFLSNPATIVLVDDNKRTQNNHNLRIGLDYDLNKSVSMGMLFKGFRNYRYRDVDNVSVYSTGTAIPDTVASVKTITNAVFTSPSVNLYLRSKMGKKGTEMTVNADYFRYQKDWRDDFLIDYADKKGNALAPKIYMNDHSPANNTVKSATLDFLLPFKTLKLETGLKYTKSVTDNDVVWQKLINNSWENDVTKTNHFIYRESIAAGYISLIRSGKKMVWQGGLRYEHTQSVGNSVTLNSSTEKKYGDLFPSFSLQYKQSKNNQYSFSYRRSIQRFGFDIVNPFIIYQSEYSYNQGNPSIRPSYFNSLDFSFAHKSRLILNMGYTFVKDPISYGYKKDPNRNTVIGSNFNFGKGRILNAGLSYQMKLLKGKWSNNSSLNYVHSEIPDFEGKLIVNDNIGLSTTNTISLSSSLTLELNAFYQSARFDGTVHLDPIFGASTGISKSVFASKGSFKLSCSDIFNTQISHLKTYGGGIQLISDWKIESRFITLLFTYRFGNTQVKQSRNRRTSIEDEKSRMGAN